MGRLLPLYCKHNVCLDPGDESFELQAEDCPKCREHWEQSEMNDRQYTKELEASCDKAVAKISRLSAENSRLTDTAHRLKRINAGQASLLAQHGIGDDRTQNGNIDTLNDRGSNQYANPDDTRQEPLYDKKRIRSHYLTGCSCTACREARDAGRPSDREYRA